MRKWEENIRKVIPYVPGDQPQGENIIKLNTNENPYPPAPGVARVMKEFVTDNLRKYPDPSVSLLVHTLADYHGLSAEQVFVGVGSDDVIAMAFLTFFNSDKPILFPDVTYSFYPVWADLYRIPFKTIKLDEKFQLNAKDYFCQNGGVIFPNPNAPTGLYLPLAEVEAIIAHNQDVIVIIDEAYIDFGEKSALKLIDKYDNLLIIRTFSKSRSMAGMRIGYAAGHRDLIKALNDIKHSYNSYTMNLPSILAGAESVKDDAYFIDARDRIIDTRETAKRRLAELGFLFPDSSTNFLFVTHPDVDAEQLYQRLCLQQIYVRYFNKPRLDQYLRISIGTKEEMEALYQVLQENI